MWISLFIIIFLIFMVCVAFTWNEGAWNNILTFFLAIFSALFATNYYAAIGVYLSFSSGFLVEYTGGGNYLWDVIAFWLIFGFTYAMLRMILDRLTKFKVKFKKPVEIGMNWLMSFSIGAFMVMIFLFTVHIAPLARHPFGGQFMFRPDMPGPSRIWMLASNYWSGNFGSLSNLWEANEFGSSQDFIERHYWRRRTLEGEKGFTVDMEESFTDPNDAQN